jgi:epoxyqueuosine reductase
MNDPSTITTTRLLELAQQHGFQQVGVSHTDLSLYESHLQQWLQQGFHGEMEYMAAHDNMRSRPQKLLPGTHSVISVSINYLSDKATPLKEILDDDHHGAISRYALGRDYHKLMRKRLQQFAKALEQVVGPFQWRVFVDSAPVMEKPLAQLAGIGWVGKHTNVISREQGSWFFLGEIYTNLALEVSTEASNHCGTCTACIEVCPTRAIIAPYQLDSRLCISYLTIEHKTAIPVTLRPLIGNRIFGCDDCQLYCPWNRFAQFSNEADFSPRHQLDKSELITLFAWDEQTFLDKTEGTPIRRAGYELWQRNIAVAMGNSANPQMIKPLQSALDRVSPLIKEHIQWALVQLQDKA